MTTYRVQVWDMDGTGFAKAGLLAEFETAKNLGYADYLNDVGESFFTLSQTDDKLARIRPYRHNAHVLIYRDDTLVWGGFLGEWEATERDVILYSYSYLGLLHFLTSDWNVSYTSAQVDTIVSEAFTRGKTTLSSSMAAWLTAGTIEAPVTTSGGATPIVLPSYRMFYKRILQIIREMAAFSIGDTTNTVTFEVTPAGVFNFWKNRGVDRDITYRYGDRQVQGFFEGFAPIARRNHVLAAGMNPNDALLKYEVSKAADITAKGRRTEPMFFSWVRDSLELERVAKLRAARAVRDDIDLSLRFYPNSITPPQAMGSALRLSDRVNVIVNRGLTQYDGLQMLMGSQVTFIRGQERVSLLLGERPGT